MIEALKVGESQILCKHCIAVQKRMKFYDEGTAYLPLPCSHYNGNTVGSGESRCSSTLDAGTVCC